MKIIRGKDKERINEQITSSKIRVVDDSGEQIGIMSPDEGLEIAYSRGMDLVEVAPQANPPVCRIMDYGKYQYQQSKKAKESKKKQHVVHLKEIKITPKTEEHDLNFKLQHAHNFLEDGDKVKLTVRFRGRQLAHKDFGEEKLNYMIQQLEDVGTVERKPFMEGRNLVTFLVPKSFKK